MLFTKFIYTYNVEYSNSSSYILLGLKLIKVIDSKRKIIMTRKTINKIRKIIRQNTEVNIMLRRYANVAGRSVP